MKLLCLSDLHIRLHHAVKAIDHNIRSAFLERVNMEVDMISPDAVIITGDTVCAEQVRLISALLRRVIPDDLPIIVTLGNHELWGRTFEETLQKLKEQTVNDKNIFYLDLIGGIEFCGVNFVGGMLFFDGSMRVRENQRVDEWNGWQDWRIVDVAKSYTKINAYYIDMIRSRMKSGISTVLCTHHVPHIKLNGHEPGHFSFYTGMQDLIHELPFDPHYNNYLICGHTHRRVIGEVVQGFMGVNVGSDYEKFESYVLEI